MICYSRNCVETIMNLVFDSTKVKWFALYHTNLSHKVSLSFVWFKFSCFGWDIDMRRIRSDKNLRLGMPKAPPRKYSRKIQATKLGDAPEGIPSFVSNIIGNLTWSYIFIRHMICVLLGASFYFVRICFMLFRIMFWISHFTMLILQVYELQFQNRKFIDVAEIPEKSQNVIKCWNFFLNNIW